MDATQTNNIVVTSASSRGLTVSVNGGKAKPIGWHDLRYAAGNGFRVIAIPASATTREVSVSGVSGSNVIISVDGKTTSIAWDELRRATIQPDGDTRDIYQRLLLVANGLLPRPLEVAEAEQKLLQEGSGGRSLDHPDLDVSRVAWQRHEKNIRLIDAEATDLAARERNARYAKYEARCVDSGKTPMGRSEWNAGLTTTEVRRVAEAILRERELPLDGDGVTHWNSHA